MRMIATAIMLTTRDVNSFGSATQDSFDTILLLDEIHQVRLIHGVIDLGLDVDQVVIACQELPLRRHTLGLFGVLVVADNDATQLNGNKIDALQSPGEANPQSRFGRGHDSAESPHDGALWPGGR